MWQIQVRSFWAKGPASTKALREGKLVLFREPKEKLPGAGFIRVRGVKTGSSDFTSPISGAG